MKILDKYPESYFDHWLAMLNTMGADLTEDVIISQIQAYTTFEGEEVFALLKKEINEIKENNDLKEFVAVAHWHDLPQVKPDELEMMERLISAD